MGKDKMNIVIFEDGDRWVPICTAGTCKVTKAQFKKLEEGATPNDLSLEWVPLDKGEKKKTKTKSRNKI